MSPCFSLAPELRLCQSLKASKRHWRLKHPQTPPCSRKANVELSVGAVRFQSNNAYIHSLGKYERTPYSLPAKVFKFVFLVVQVIRLNLGAAGSLLQPTGSSLFYPKHTAHITYKTKSCVVSVSMRTSIHI